MEHQRGEHLQQQCRERRDWNNNPAAILSVKGSALPSPQWSGYTSSMQVGELMIQDYNVIPQVGIMQNVYWDGSANKYILNGYASQMYMGANGSIAFSVYNSGTSGNAVSGTGVAMTIANNGNVGIGTPSPDTKLAVNGTIHSKSVVIDLNGWADYVFKPAYQLPPLMAVKNYIDQNQHLPEIPSEQEIAKNGLNLGEMNKLLMKKVEELTLYAIENERKDKERETTKDKLLASLQEQINLLKEQLTAIQKGNKTNQTNHN
ncbi:hypothetical protein [Mucilaginibacter sp. 3215]|uniref:hypothetical protein n=1 Tax=Mucilaginibacter sp. 3215 TaxID=3373912 RepID=UPI003D242EE7